MDLGLKTHGFTPDSVPDYLIQAVESAAANKEYIACIHLDKVLLGMFPAPFGRNVRHGSLYYLQKGLLDPLAGHIAGNGRAVQFPGDLVDFINVYDALTCGLNVIIGHLNQVQDDIFHVFAYISRLCKCGGISDRERDFQDLGEGLRQKGFTAACGSDQEDVAFLDLNPFHVYLGIYPFVVVMNRHGKDLLWLVLFNHILVQCLFYFSRLRQLISKFFVNFLTVFFGYNLIT